MNQTRRMKVQTRQALPAVKVGRQELLAIRAHLTARLPALSRPP